MSFNMRDYQRNRRRNSAEIRNSDNERTKRYQATDKGRAALKAGWMNTAAKLRGAEGRVTGPDILLLLADPACACPGCLDSGPYEVDHIHALILGGLNKVDNLCLLCIKHHALKSAQERRMKAGGDDHLAWVLQLQGKQSSQLRLL